MKTKCLILLAAISFAAHGQGNVGIGDSGLAPYIPPPSAASVAAARWRLRVQSVPPDHAVYRSVNGQTYNILYAQVWQVVSGKVYQQQDNILVLQNYKLVLDQVTGNGWQPVYYAITNYSGNPTVDAKINILAMRTGNFDMGGGMQIALYDCGIPSSPPPPTSQEIAAAKAAATLRQERIRESQTNAFHWLLMKSTNGSASDQYDLALHYLNGQGCETNKQQAIFWMRKSAAQGDSEASNVLARLQH